METNILNAKETTAPVITADELLKHWQGHLSLTRRVIESFPEDKLFSYSLGGMRTFAELAMEMIKMAGPGVRGVATGNWGKFDDGDAAPQSKKELLELWDKVTIEIENYWPQISPTRFQEMDVAFGQYEGPIYWTIFYFIDNEIHHRGQGYVYLRSLGITPPPFWER